MRAKSSARKSACTKPVAVSSSPSARIVLPRQSRLRAALLSGARPGLARERAVMIRAGIVGGTGYTGVELLRLLARHPQVALVTITSRQEAGLPVKDLFPNLRGAVDLAFADPKDAPLSECDVVFFAT